MDSHEKMQQFKIDTPRQKVLVNNCQGMPPASALLHRFDPIRQAMSLISTVTANSVDDKTGEQISVHIKYTQLKYIAYSYNLIAGDNL